MWKEANTHVRVKFKGELLLFPYSVRTLQQCTIALTIKIRFRLDPYGVM